MTIRPRTLGYVTYHAAINTVEHDGIEHAGYLAFLTLLAIFPFMVFLVALTGFLGQAGLGQQFIAVLFDMLPHDVVSALQPRVDEIISGPSVGLLTVSILGAIWTASSAVEGYRTVLNRAYHVGTPPAYIWRRLLAIMQLLIFTFFILSGMVLMIVVPVVLEWLDSRWDFSVSMLFSYKWLVRGLTALMLVLVVAQMHFVLPNVKQKLLNVLPGTILTVSFWVLSASLFTQYLARFDQINIIYGSLGGYIAVLLFFYFINVIFIYGAELNYLLIRAHGEAVQELEATPEHPPQENVPH